MSITVSNTSINYGGTSSITINDLLNVSITPYDSVINTEYNGTSTVIYTVKPTISTLYYIFNKLISFYNINYQYNILILIIIHLSIIISKIIKNLFK